METYVSHNSEDLTKEAIQSVIKGVISYQGRLIEGVIDSEEKMDGSFGVKFKNGESLDIAMEKIYQAIKNNTWLLSELFGTYGIDLSDPSVINTIDSAVSNSVNIVIDSANDDVFAA